MMNRRSGFDLFPILMLAVLLLGYGSQRAIQSAQTALPQQPAILAGLEPTQKPASAGVDSAAGIGVDILSDTQGVDFDPYLRQMLKLLQKNWEAIMPEEAKMGEKGKVKVTLEILPDGTLAIGDPQIEKSSDVKVLDEAAMNAIRHSVPFASLPQQFHGPYVKLRVLFLYNIKLSEAFKTPPGKE
jgi:TonB family protein